MINKYGWIKKYCLSFKGAVRDIKEEWEAVRYLVGGKMFALEGELGEKRLVVTLKLEPSKGELFRDVYEEVIPGYYMNKVHWNTIYLDGDVPEEVLKDMLSESYALVLKSLPRTVREGIES